MGTLWECSENIAENAVGMLWESCGTAMRILRECCENVVGMLRECCRNAVGMQGREIIFFSGRQLKK